MLLEKCHCQGNSRPYLRAAIAITLCQVFATPTLAQPITATLGTLVYSPEERRAIAANRRGGETARPDSGASLYLSGVVSRSGRKGTAWINGQAVHEGESIPSVGAPVVAPGRVLLGGKSVQVRESLDVETGSRIGMPGSASVTVRSAK